MVRDLSRGLWIGISLIVIGMIGGTTLAIFLFADPYDNFEPGRIRAEGDFSSLDERIYLTGTNQQGEYIPRDRASMRFASCADCHGRDGRGRVNSTMMFEFDAPDIRWSTLTGPQTDEEGEVHIPYDRGSFSKALRQGVEPNGKKPDPPMPKWEMSDQEIDSLSEYLQGL